MADGRWLMRDSKIAAVDEADIVRQAERIGHEAWSRVVEKYPDVPFPIRLPPRPLGD